MDFEEKWHLIQQKALTLCLASIFDEFRISSIDAICLKGWSVARFYPEGRIRSYNDIDLVVANRDYEKALELVRKGQFSGIAIDLHRGIRDRDTLSWEQLFSRSYLTQLHDAEVRVLGDEDNLRITSTHWLIDGGEFKEKLWDIFYLVSNRREVFDWDRCLNAAGPTRRTWVLAAVATARDYLGLNVSGLPREFTEFELPSWYKETLERKWVREPMLRIPLLSCWKRPDLLVQQIQRGFPPNPIAATTDTEGAIDHTARWPYQLKSIKKKLINASPFARRN